MAQTLVTVPLHIVFSTRNRVESIVPEIETPLYSYMSSTIKRLDCSCLAINGTTDHTHLLISLAKHLKICDLLREIKKGSSRWVNENFDLRQRFTWQDGYAAFAVCQSQIETVKQYIARQKEHHQKFSYQKELLTLLDRHELEYDERYLWL